MVGAELPARDVPRSLPARPAASVPPRRGAAPGVPGVLRRLRAAAARRARPGRDRHHGGVPERLVDGLRKLGAFGMKIPKEYGGLGFTNREYQRIMELVGSVDGNLSALLSAHQSIGVPQPLKLFGSDQLKKKYLPRCARGEISAFALTEPDVGSDPARLETNVLSEDGSHYVLNGTKLWCTNGPSRSCSS
ncbi:MAG: acyl-CoA dehydrogenase family protein [Thermoanaerobaculia bacterium]